MEKEKKYECPYCGQKLQNPQALQMHIKWKHSSEATKNKAQKSEKATKPLNEEENNFEDLEIEEAETRDEEIPQEVEGKNFCPQCNFQLKDYENPCPNCNAEIEWGD